MLLVHLLPVALSIQRVYSGNILIVMNECPASCTNQFNIEFILV